MKKNRGSFLIAALLLASFGVTVLAAGGTAGDPLISKSYLEGTFTSELRAQAEELGRTRGETVLQNALTDLNTRGAAANERLRLLREGYDYQASFVDFRAKQADQIIGVTGTGFLLLAGEAQITYSGGAVVDVTEGSTVPSGTAARRGHRYLAAENTTLLVEIVSPTAVVSADGYFFHAASGSLDYNALTDALKALGLFRGSDTPYGSGYALEERPTRIQALVMFLRILGEEDAALRSTATNPFRDADEWCDRYLAYAFARGYTNGTNLPAGEFTPLEPVSADQYLTFLLRAAGYQDSGETPDFAWDRAVADARGLGVLTAGEERLLTSGVFYRAHMVYVSYFGLTAPLKDGSATILGRLIANGVFSEFHAASVQGTVPVARVLE